MGEQWHDDGKLMNKKNTFNDFVDVGQYLVDNHYTSKDRLIANGGSAGGLLMGAVVNMRPDLFKAVVADVPFVDVINTMMDASIPLTAQEWQSVLDLNLTSVFLCSQAAARAMKQAGGGAIVNTASIQGLTPFPRRLAYGTTKAGVVMMTQILAAEWAPEIRVNAVAPGYTRTEMVEDLRRQGKLDYDSITSRTPLRRLAEPDEMAPAYVYLASDDSRFVTGQTIAVDGGWTSFGAYAGF